MEKVVIIKSPHQLFAHLKNGCDVIGYDSTHTRNILRLQAELLSSPLNTKIILQYGIIAEECELCPLRMDGETPGPRFNPRLIFPQGRFEKCDPVTSPRIRDANDNAMDLLEEKLGKTEGITVGDLQLYRRNKTFCR